MVSLPGLGEDPAGFRDALFLSVPPSQDRPHIGGSCFGSECDRQIWMDWRLCTSDTHSPRMLRLFETGHREELRVIAGLECTKALPIPVTWSFYAPETQLGWVDREYTNGHLSGSIDAAFLSNGRVVAILDVKTANDKNFAKIQSQGIQKAKPGYYTQMQIYMALGQQNGEPIEAAYLVVVRKSDDNIYSERVEFSKRAATNRMKRAARIVNAETPPARMPDHTKFPCTWCDHYNSCQLPTGHRDSRDKFRKNCRTCKEVRAVENGKWWCDEYGKVLSFEEQLEGCGSWESGLDWP